MTIANDLRLIGLTFVLIVLIVLIAGCAGVFKPDDAAPRPSATATRSQPATSTSPGSTTSSSRSAPAVSGPLVTPAPPAPPPAPTVLQLQLADAIRLFDAGEFFAAVGRLRNLPDLNTASVETQLKAMKYLAFSYCVTSRRTLCQQQFEAALKVDPKFELAPAERGHPIWKVYFERAKRAVANGSVSKGSNASGVKPVDAKTGDAKTGDAKTSKSTSKVSRRRAKVVPQTSADSVDSRPPLDQRPQ